MGSEAKSKGRGRGRGRGRPRSKPGGTGGVVDRDVVIDLAYEQTKTVSLDTVSFVGLAAELGVVPGSLHYHIGTKDDLASAVLNRFYQTLLRRLSQIPEDLDWRERVRRFAWTLMTAEREHRGAAAHIQAKAKYRIFQKVKAGEPDYGAAFLDWAFMLFRDSGFSATEAAKLYHVLALYCLASATSESTRLEPAAHESFLLERASSYRSEEMPGLKFALTEFARITAEETFEFGLDALIERFAAMRTTHKSDGSQVAKPGTK